MAKLILDDVAYDLPDGARIDDVCEQNGIPFSCNTGICGSCQIKILDGVENLNALSEDEINLGMDPDNRLSCQCVIKHGTVKATC